MISTDSKYLIQNQINNKGLITQVSELRKNGQSFTKQKRCRLHLLLPMEISYSTNHVQFIECKNLKKQICTSPGMSQKQIISVESTNI